MGFRFAPMFFQAVVVVKNNLEIAADVAGEIISIHTSPFSSIGMLIQVYFSARYEVGVLL